MIGLGPLGIEDGVLVSTEDVEVFAVSGCVPEEAGHVEGCGDEAFPVGGVGEGIDGSGVPCEFHGGVGEAGGSVVGGGVVVVVVVVALFVVEGDGLGDVFRPLAFLRMGHCGCHCCL